jgi:hypothetical protein
MTHFTVLVIGNDVESILAPYDENMVVEEHIDRTKEDIHKEFVDYKERLLKMIESGEAGGELRGFEKLTQSLETENQEWVKDWCGQDLDDEGNTLSTYNPDSKWDWYQVGGRWTGTFIMRPGETGELGDKSWCNEDDEIPGNRADVAEKGQIDWDTMNQNSRDQAARDWDDLMNPNPDTCHYKPEYVTKQRELHLKMYGTKEEYVKRRGVWTPYAYVDYNGWNAPGKMGWFGMSSDQTEDRDRYDREFVNYIASLPDSTLLSMVDCHI